MACFQSVHSRRCSHRNYGRTPKTVPLATPAYSAIPFGEDLSRGPKNGAGLSFGTDNRQFVPCSVPERGFAVEVRNAAELSASVPDLSVFIRISFR